MSLPLTLTRPLSIDINIIHVSNFPSALYDNAFSRKRHNKIQLTLFLLYLHTAPRLPIYIYPKKAKIILFLFYLLKKTHFFAKKNSHLPNEKKKRKVKRIPKIDPEFILQNPHLHTGSSLPIIFTHALESNNI